MRLTYNNLSPVKLFVGTWVLVHVAAFFGPAGQVYQRYGVVDVTFTPHGFLWVTACIAAFLVGAKLANQKLLVISSPFRDRVSASDDLNIWDSWRVNVSSIPILTFAAGIALLLVYWTAVAIFQVGSLSSFLSTLVQSWHDIRNLWPNQKPFTGARLLYTGLIGVVIFAASGIGLTEFSSEGESDSELPSNSRAWLVILTLGLVPLMILPLLVSQRILLATAITGGIAAYTATSDRGISLKYPVGGLLTGMTVWTSQEVIRAGLSTETIGGSIRYGVSRLLLYFTNDVGNLHRGIKHVSGHTYGTESFSFVLSYLFIKDEIKGEYFQSVYRELSLYIGGGGFTGLGVPYLDFGVFGLILVLIWGYASQSFYIKAKSDIISAQIYGLLASSIVLSWHTSILSNPLFWFNASLLIVFGTYIPAVELRIMSDRDPESS